MKSAYAIWAKSDPPHPLWCHLIDVGSCAAALWDDVLNEHTKSRLARALGKMPAEIARAWFIWFAALHDLGKASPEFQFKHEALSTPVRSHLRFPRDNEPVPHGYISAFLIKKILFGRGWHLPDAKDMATAVGSHHGDLVPERAPECGLPRLSAAEKNAWAEARANLVETVEDALGLHATRLPENQPKDLNRVHLIELAGIISFVDWIGSSSQDGHFGSRDPGVQHQWFHQSSEPNAYSRNSLSTAQRVLREFGWQATPTLQRLTPWEQLFSFPSPNPLQSEVKKLLEHHPQTRFLLVEAPMGEGKTEVALYAAAHWIAAHSQSGAYVALPTQATSNAMYLRINEWVQKMHGHGAHESLLVHGGLVHPEIYDAIKRETFFRHFQASTAYLQTHESDSPKVPPRITAHTWFLPLKRALLASYGTGTVDQALLGVLRAKHHFVRLAGLAGKTVVFDEIHAYDVYTSTLIERLLEYLAAMDCTVVLLSATLPASRRAKLFEAFTGQQLSEHEKITPYPRIVAGNSGRSISIGGIATSERAKKDVRLEWLPEELELSVDHFVDQLKHGGCGAFIFNTVGAAQKAYSRAREKYRSLFERIILFHSRFTSGRRMEIEREVVDFFGKNSSCRPQRALVLATQVIEQSLDLDFDIMASDIAPIDLLLQRCGRLHRHQRDTRPELLTTPRLYIRGPRDSDLPPEYGKANESVYARSVLLRTHAVLLGVMHKDPVIAIPDGVTDLIESVYADDNPDTNLRDDWRLSLAEADKDLEEKKIGDLRNAASRSLCRVPDIEEYWNNINPMTKDDDDASIHPDQRALTRLGEPSVRVACLHMVDGVLCFDPDGQDPLPDNISSAVLQRILAAVAAFPISWLDHKVPAGLYWNCPPHRDWETHGILRHLPLAGFSRGGLDLGGKCIVHWSQQTGFSRMWK